MRLMVKSVPPLWVPLPVTGGPNTTPPPFHLPVHIQDAVCVAVDHVDEQLCLCEVYPPLHIHMELGRRELVGVRLQGLPWGWDATGRHHAGAHPSIYHSRLSLTWLLTPTQGSFTISLIYRQGNGGPQTWSHPSRPCGYEMTKEGPHLSYLFPSPQSSGPRTPAHHRC